jgi:hypothetical protein
VEASSGSPGAHINERMIADALIEAGLVTGRRLVGSDLRAWQQLWTYDEQTFPNPVKGRFADHSSRIVGPAAAAMNGDNLSCYIYTDYQLYHWTPFFNVQPLSGKR